MNTKLFGLFIALLVCLPSLAQQKPVEKVDSDGVYLMPDQMPEFPGGMQAMMKFLTTNIKYPVEAQKWKPGMDRGEAVKVRFTAPIMFNLSRPEAQRPTFPELVVPIGQEVENRSLQGVWQSCVVQPGEHGYKILLLPVIKIISPDQTFMNIMTAGMNGRSNAIIYCQGEYSLPSDGTYVEMVEKSVDPVFIQGVKNEISVERLHDNLIKLSFTVPGQGRKVTEYWFRAPSPDVKIMAD